MSFQSVSGTSEVCVYKDMGEKISFQLRRCQGQGRRRRGQTASWWTWLWILLSGTILKWSTLELPRCSGDVSARSNLGALLPSFPSRPTILFFLYLPFQDFTSSQSWSVESSTSDSPTSIAMISEISESLLIAGSCSPEGETKFMVNTELCLQRLNTTAFNKSSLMPKSWWYSG